MKPKTTFLLMMITLTASLARATEPDPDSPSLKAHDAIALSIQETREVKKFVGLILKITHQAPDLKPCVGRLVYDLDAMQSTLHQMKYLKGTELDAMQSTLNQMKHLKGRNLSADVNSLKKYMTHSVALSQSCHKSFKNVDEIVPTMLTGKLNGLSMVINAVVRHVSSKEGDVYGAEINLKPREKY